MTAQAVEWDQAAVALAEERRAAAGTADIASTAVPLAGGFLCWEAPGSWANEAVGIGFEALAPGELDALIGFYTERGAPARVVLAPTAHPTWIAALRDAGFAITRFENVLFRPLDGPVQPPSTEDGPLGPDGLRLVRVDPADDAQVRRHAELAGSGFAGPDGITPEEIAFGERIVRHPRTIAVAAELEGLWVGAGTAEAAGPVGGLFATSVLPAFRRRGIQQALMAARLAALRTAGCTIATVTSEPGIATERNARRMGFVLAYTRATVVRPLPPGPAP